MNFLFVSPHFPDNMWRYCRALKDNGVNVLGVGDLPFDALPPHLQDALSDYFHVNSLEDMGEMVRALGYMTWHWGKLDWLESNNEHWLTQDARLREQFHITTGPLPDQMPLWKKKSLMKAGFDKAGVKTAPWRLAKTLPEALAFARSVGYPMIVKPDSGVGAMGTYRIGDDAAMQRFFEHLPDEPYIMEKFVAGEICSYDALIDSGGAPVYETGNITRGSIMDFVNEHQDCVFYIVPQPADDILEAGRRCAAAFGVKSRFIHLEFFRLSVDQPGLGQKGDVLGLEVNMRPSGGYSSDMMNYAGSVDIYRMWADLMLRDRVGLPPDRSLYYCLYLGRRDSTHYAHQHHDILGTWPQVVMHARLPRALSGAMGDQGYLVRCRDENEMNAFLAYAQLREHNA